MLNARCCQATPHSSIVQYRCHLFVEIDRHLIIPEHRPFEATEILMDAVFRKMSEHCSPDAPPSKRLVDEQIFEPQAVPAQENWKTMVPKGKTRGMPVPLGYFTERPRIFTEQRLQEARSRAYDIADTAFVCRQQTRHGKDCFHILLSSASNDYWHGISCEDRFEVNARDERLYEINTRIASPVVLLAVAKIWLNAGTESESEQLPLQRVGQIQYSLGRQLLAAAIASLDPVFSEYWE
jgi:hypothetical protein